MFFNSFDCGVCCSCLVPNDMPSGACVFSLVLLMLTFPWEMFNTAFREKDENKKTEQKVRRWQL